MGNTDAGVRARTLVPSAALLASLLLGLSGMASGQEKKDFALIYGTVWGADDRAVPGVPIKIQRVGDKKPKWTLVSDRRGEFAQRVPPGKNDYTVTAEIKGHKDAKKPETTAHVEKNERVDISLHLPK